VDYRVDELRHDQFDTERKESSRISDQVREKSKYENAVFLLLLVVCLAIALIFGKLL
jgi:cell division protein FtsL